MTINCKGKILNFDSPIVMGILNITPDSFYDGNTLLSDKDIINRAKKMLLEGATIIDIGGYSSRPGATDIDVETEINRIVKPIALLVKEFPDIIISIDTFRSQVAQEAINNGACIVNDISAGDGDENMFNTVKKNQVPYIIMHKKGTPKNMQNKPLYKDVAKEVFQYLNNKISELNKLGVNDIIIDPGFGFGKSIEHNYTLLNELNYFNLLEVPVLVGLSRKSMIHKSLEIEPKDALNGTTALNMVALQNGANILRVHDVKEAIECINLFKKLSS
jgi:dihydropteroate synthase